MEDWKNHWTLAIREIRYRLMDLVLLSSFFSFSLTLIVDSAFVFLVSPIALFGFYFITAIIHGRLSQCRLSGNLDDLIATVKSRVGDSNNFTLIPMATPPHIRAFRFEPDGAMRPHIDEVSRATLIPIEIRTEKEGPSVTIIISIRPATSHAYRYSSEIFGNIELGLIQLLGARVSSDTLDITIIYSSDQEAGRIPRVEVETARKELMVFMEKLSDIDPNMQVNMALEGM